MVIKSPVERSENFMKKIAHITTSSISHKILVDKLTVLQKKGYDIHFISSKEGYDAELMKNYNFTLKFIKMRRKINIFSDFISIIKMTRLLRQEKYDIVHTHTAKAGVIGRIAAKLAKIPIVVHTSHGLPFYENQSLLKNKMYRLFEKIGSYFCDAISSQNKEDLEEMKKFAPNKSVFYEGNGVDLQLLDRLREEISSEGLKDIEKQLNIKESTKIILVGARFEPIKNHDFLLQGLRELKKLQADFVCILAGKGVLKNEIKSKIDQYGLSKHVIMIGYQLNIYPYIELADIVALTSIKEGIPRIIMEAMSYEKPIVATNVLGTRELVIHETNGLLVSLQDVNYLACAFHRLLKDDHLRKTYGLAGRKIIESKFTEEIVVDRLVDMYTEIEGKSKKFSYIN